LSIFERFSQRQKRQQGNMPDIYQYDVLSEPFRIQVIHILLSTIGIYRHPTNTSSFQDNAYNSWWNLFRRFAREIGVLNLDDPEYNPYEQCKAYLIKKSTSEVIDFIECAFQFIDRDIRNNDMYLAWRHDDPGMQSPDDAIEELNHRFQEHSIGYYFANGQLTKQTDQYIHAHVVLPALLLLQDPLFKGAQEEFLKAHQHYLKQNYKESINEALKAFESTMKIICKAQQWNYNPNAPSKVLISTLFDQSLIPPMLDNQFAQLRLLLESGLPTVRNKRSGHGQGADPIVVPEYLAAYALHTAAANIVFIVNAYKENQYTLRSIFQGSSGHLPQAHAGRNCDA
jgi:hypothetical protein